MKLSQLSLADYNQLDSIPVINQDLSASGFTPVANTYYRHTGATTETFTQGVIYLYDTAYHKLGESGGGTTLNRYELTISTGSLVSNTSLIYNIYQNAKGRVTVGKYLYTNSSMFFRTFTPVYVDNIYVKFSSIEGNNGSIMVEAYDCGNYGAKRDYISFLSDKSIAQAGVEDWNDTIKIIYYNDIEIT